MKASFIEHWDGTTWNVIASPYVGESALSGVTATSANDVWAVGYNYNSRIRQQPLDESLLTVENGMGACPFPFSVLGHYCSGRDFIQPLSTAINSSGSSINTICPECSNTCRWVLGIFSAISTAPAIGVTQS